MKFHTEYLQFHTRKHREYIHITPQIEAIVKKSGIKEGMVLVLCHAYYRGCLRER